MFSPYGYYSFQWLVQQLKRNRCTKGQILSSSWAMISGFQISVVTAEKFPRQTSIIWPPEVFGSGNSITCQNARPPVHHAHRFVSRRRGAISIGNVLKQGGYTTLQFGKEHFRDWVPQRCYAKNAMDHSLVYWTINEYFLPPSGQYSHPFELDGKALSPDQIEHRVDPLYKTDFVTDYALKYLDEASKKDAPFFLYLPYNSAHYPLQARPEDIALFRGKYKVGWDSLRQARYERMVQMGVLDSKYQLSPPEGNINKFRGHPKGDDERRAKIPLYRPWNTLGSRKRTNWT